MLHIQYRHFTLPGKHAVGFDSECPENLDDVFVDVHLQMKQTEKVPKKFSYVDLKEEMEGIQ